MDVLISIQSVQNLDGRDSDGPELITMGDYEYGEDGICLSYLETALTGLQGTKTTFQIRPPEEVALTRRGSVNAQTIFRVGEKHSFRYQTGIGTLGLGVNTRRLEMDLDAHGGDLQIEYDLSFEHSYLSRNKFIIKVREKEQKL